MQGPLAQMFALTCHGNAALHGRPLAPFLASNSTCQFCNSVSFIAGGQPVAGEMQQFTLAETPDQWLENLSKRGIKGLRLLQQSRNDERLSDRESAGFVGGGRLWKIEGIREGGQSEFWLNRWEVVNRHAEDKRIWKVTYGLVEVSPTKSTHMRGLEEIASDLGAALAEIRRFAEAHKCEDFARCFSNGLGALDDPKADIGYHKDLYPPGVLIPRAESVLKAAQVAWVFGGMGSWNDMGFEGNTQVEYHRVSDRLFALLNEGIAAAATNSAGTE